MATQTQINQHDELIRNLVREMQSILEGVLPTALTGLVDIDLTDRVAISNLFSTVRDGIVNQIQGLDTLAISNLNLNSVEPTPQISETVNTLKGAVNAQMNIAIDEEVNSIAGELAVAGLLGLGIGEIIRSVQDRVPAMVGRLGRAYDRSLITFTSVLTRNLGGQRYRYAGGLIPSSRPFCTAHDGNSYTETEINRIWAGTWEGKAPGDPFVVRGGYNCRHFWILGT